MTQIRDTIELLARVLRSNGTSKVKAETFRLAKFDNDEAVEPFWKLLFEIVYFCNHDHIDEISVMATTELSTEELVVYVKRELQKRGFFSREFALLPNQMSEGSRELLLAFGWLMCKENVIDKFMQKCSSPLDDDTNAAHRVEFDESYKPSNALRSPRSPRVPDDPVGRVKYLLWLNGKLRLNLRSLYAMQREKNILAHKIREATQGVSLSPDRNHLSVLEVMMLRHPELLKKNLQLLEKDNERLQDLLKWKETEDVFWTWMESVLDAKLQEAVARKEHQRNLDDVKLPYNIPPESVNEMTESRAMLQDAITKYEAIYEHLERLWTSKSANVSKDDLDQILVSIDLEIQLQKASISLNSPEAMSSNRPALPDFGDASFILSPQTSKRTPSKQVNEENDPECVEIKQGIDRLETALRTVEEELDRKYVKFRGEMENISTKFNGDVVCIPPMSNHHMQ